MSIRNLIPAGLVLALLAGCSGTTTSTANEQSVGFDANAKASCSHKGCEGTDKAACEAKAKECATECPHAKDAAPSSTNG